MNNSNLDIIICDDHYISAFGLQALLKKIYNDKIKTRLSSSGEEGLVLFQEKEPDLMILDLGLPKMSGLDLIKELHPHLTFCQLIVMTGSEDSELFKQVLKYNIRALLKKSNSEHNLFEAIKFIDGNKTGIFIDSSFSKILKEEKGAVLTAREYEVLELMSQGHTSQEIADRLNCSLSTIKTYRMRIMNKSGARNSSEMIAWFLTKRER